jgi:hypothetical protein
MFRKAESGPKEYDENCIREGIKRQTVYMKIKQ